MTQPNHKPSSAPLSGAHKVHQKKRHASIAKKVLFVLTICVLSATLSGMYFFNLGKREHLAQSATLQSYKPGDTIQTAHMDVRVWGITFDQKGGHAFKPAKGNQFVTLTLFVKNKTDQAMPVYPVNQTYLKDDQGHVYRSTVAELADPLQAGHLKPGDQIQGQIVFEVPASLQHPLFFFDSGWSDSFISVKM